MASQTENSAVSTKRADKKANGKQSISVDAASPINVTVTGEVQLKSADQQPARQEHAFYQHPEWWLVGVTIFLVWVTSKLALFTRKLWKTTGDLVTGAEKTASRQLRAYVLPVGGSMKLSDPEQPIEIYVEFRNSGQTPGYKLTTWLNVELRDMPQFEPIIKPVAPPEHRPSESVIGPNSLPHYAGYKLKVSPDDLALIRAGIKRIYVWGRLDYVDAFEVERWATFQYFGMDEIPGKGWALFADKKGNEAN